MQVIQKWPWPTEETDSAGQVEAIVQEKLREEVISEVLVDLLLDMQQITVDEGLVYVLDNDLEEIPVSGMEAVVMCINCGALVLMEID